MCVPLRDQHGKVRYYLGAQLDITELVNNCTELPSLRQLMDQQIEQSSQKPKDVAANTPAGNEFEKLSEAFNPQELDQLVMLRRREKLESNGAVGDAKSEAFIEDEEPFRTPSIEGHNTFQLNGLSSAPPLGFYQNVNFIP